MSTRFHPLFSKEKWPLRLNNPFYYEPHPLALQAAKDLQQHLPSPAEGKMYGVLVVENNQHSLGYLAAYSGQIEKFDESKEYFQEGDFVPMVFDYLAPDGYFKANEALISQLNKDILALEQSEERQAVLQQLHDAKANAQAEIEKQRKTMAQAKHHRDEMRSNGTITAELQEQLIRESQFQKAEFRRIKKKFQAFILPLQQFADKNNEDITAMKQQRRKQSDNLQQWLFSHFLVSDSHGKTDSLLNIFKEAIGRIPPSGAGECCEPKLLNYAFTHQLRPLSMAMFWWGESPKGEIRLHKHFYPACQGKCKPILDWMLRDVDIEPNPLEQADQRTIKILYEDEMLAVIYKPEGMLSVPGKSGRASVASLMRQHWPTADSPLIVHRLDMATSGLMIVAKNKRAHYLLQKQFKDHTVKKKYVALLERPIDKNDGVVNLPIRPDLQDRPRQMVDYKNGRQAFTRYHVVEIKNGKTRIELYPETGRTHQLRVHCASPLGLNAPIVGDRLYGHPADRLYLHAESITFTHPSTGKTMTFEEKTI